MISSQAIQTTSPLYWPGWRNCGTGSITVSRCLPGCGKTRLLRNTLQSTQALCRYQHHPQDVQKGRPARPQQAKRRIVLAPYGEPSERRENAAGGLFPHPAIALGDGLFELRHVGKLNTRVLWFFMRRNRIIAVHGIRNKGRAIPSRDLATARERMRDWWRRVQS